MHIHKRVHIELGIHCAAVKHTKEGVCTYVSECLSSLHSLSLSLTETLVNFLLRK